MNIYGIDAGNKQKAVYEDFSVMAGHWEYYRAVGLVAAMTRGQARSIVANHEDLSFTEPMKITLIARNVSVSEPGIFEDWTDENKYWLAWTMKDEELLPIGSVSPLVHSRDLGQLVVVAYGTIWSVQIEVYRCQVCGQEFDQSQYEQIGYIPEDLWKDLDGEQAEEISD